MNNYSQTITETNARAYAKLAGIAAAGVIVVSISLAATGAIIAGALGYDAVLVGGSIIAAGIVIAALFGWDAIRLARWMFVEQMATYFSKHNADAKKVNAEAERILAEADRIDAESAALTRASAGAAQVNVNSGSGNMKVQNKPIQYNVAGHSVGQLTINQTNQIDQRKIEIPAADVRWFAEQIAGGYGHSKNKWVKAKVELPYSRHTVDYEIYKTLIDPLAQADPPAIIGRNERVSGKLIEQNPAQLVKLIEQTHPGAGSKGIIITTPAPSV